MNKFSLILVALFSSSSFAAKHLYDRYNKPLRERVGAASSLVYHDQMQPQGPLADSWVPTGATAVHHVWTQDRHSGTYDPNHSSERPGGCVPKDHEQCGMYSIGYQAPAATGLERVYPPRWVGSANSVDQQGPVEFPEATSGIGQFYVELDSQSVPASELFYNGETYENRLVREVTMHTIGVVAIYVLEPQINKWVPSTSAEQLKGAEKRLIEEGEIRLVFDLSAAPIALKDLRMVVARGFGPMIVPYVSVKFAD